MIHQLSLYTGVMRCLHTLAVEDSSCITCTIPETTLRHLELARLEQHFRLALALYLVLVGRTMTHDTLLLVPR